VSEGLRYAGSAASSLALTLLLTPAAIRVAVRTGFVDRPSGWKTHGGATPYLGGVSVALATAIAALAFTDDAGRIGAVLAGAVALLAVGLVDDRVRLHATPRLLAEVAAAYWLWSQDLGWEFADPGWLDLLLTCAWVIAAVNALNLLDLMDGVAASVAAVAAAGCAVLAGIDGDASFAVLGAALAAACTGFLFFNLATPARVFLGDGGTMAIGYAIAALAMVSVGDHSDGAESIAAAACLFGIPLLDMSSRVILRLARHIPLMTPGPDSMANRLLDRLGTPRRVALAAALAQAALSAAAILALRSGGSTVAAVFAVALAAGACAAYALQAGSPRPAGSPGA